MVTDLDRLQAAKRVADAIFEAIEASGDRGIPSGHLYAMLMDRMSLNTYQSIIGILVKAGKVTNTFHLLKAVQK